MNSPASTITRDCLEATWQRLLLAIARFYPVGWRSYVSSRLLCHVAAYRASPVDKTQIIAIHIGTIIRLSFEGFLFDKEFKTLKSFLTRS